MTAPRVLLMRLSIRQSARGTEYLSGYLGLSRVVAFKGKEPDKFGNEQWEVFVAEPEPKSEPPKQEVLPPPRRGQGTWDRSRDHGHQNDAGGDGGSMVHRNERRDPRQEHVDELARRFDERGPDDPNELFREDSP